MAMGNIAWDVTSKVANIIPLVNSGKTTWILFFLAYDFGSVLWFSLKATPQYVPGNIANEVGTAHTWLLQITRVASVSWCPTTLV